MIPPFYVPPVSPAATIPIAAPEVITTRRPRWKQTILDAHRQFVHSRFAQTALGHVALGLLRKLTGGRLGWLPDPPPQQRSTNRYRPQIIDSEITVAIMNATELYSQPLAGVWDPPRLKEKVRKIVEARLGPASPKFAPVLEERLDAFVFEIPRANDRYLLIESILQVTNSVELYGPNWETHSMFAPYHKGRVTGNHALFDIYGRSRINGANTQRSLLHRRNLECMGVGGFIFTNYSPHGKDVGGLDTFFEPGVHYGQYTPDNIQEEALRWLRNDAERLKIGQQAAEAIRSKHLWRHRADQILSDLQ